jgi:hypothetical protein
VILAHAKIAHMLATFVAIFIGCGLLLVLLAVPLLRRRVPPNGWYGLRVAATFANESVWYDANARSGRDLLILGVMQILLALVLAAAPIAPETYALLNVAALVAGALTCAIAGIRRANRLLAARR